MVEDDLLFITNRAHELRNGVGLRFTLANMETVAIPVHKMPVGSRVTLVSAEEANGRSSYLHVKCDNNGYSRFVLAVQLTDRDKTKLLDVYYCSLSQIFVLMKSRKRMDIHTGLYDTPWDAVEASIKGLEGREDYVLEKGQAAYG